MLNLIKFATLRKNCNNKRKFNSSGFNAKSYVLVMVVLAILFMISCKKENSESKSTNSSTAPVKNSVTTTASQENANALVFTAGNNAVNPNNPINILFLGDSLTEGYRLQQQYSYPSQMGQALAAAGVSTKIVNAGVNGDTSSGGLFRIKWQLKSTSPPPHIVVVALGANDGLRGLKVENLKQNLQEIITVGKENNAVVVLAGMQIPLNYGETYVESFKSTYKSLAKENEIPLIPFLLAGVAGEASLNLEDGIHPNPEGYKKVAYNVLEVVQPIALALVQKQ